MYNVSNDFLKAIKENGRTFKGAVTINGITFDDNNIVEIDLEENVNPTDSFMIGGVGSSQLDVILVNVPDTVVIENARISASIGLLVYDNYEDVSLGKFIVDEVNKSTDGTNTIKLTCYDYMILYEKDYSSDLSYPANIQDVAEEICKKVGVELASTLPSIRINKIEGHTYREAIGYIASFLGGFSRFNRGGKLEITTYLDSEVSITPDNYFPPLTTSEQNFTVGRLTCKIGTKKDDSGNQVDDILTAGTVGNEIQFENPLMTQEQLNNIYAILKTVSYLPYSTDWQGNQALQSGDKITITDTKGKTFNTLVMNNKLTYKGGLKGHIEAVGKTETGQEFNSTGNITNSINKIQTEQASIKEALIDKASIEDLEATDARIKNLVVGTAQIADEAVTNAKICNEAVDNSKIKDASINNAKIVDATIEGAKIAKATIDTANMKNGAITTAIIADEAVGNAQIANVSAVKVNTGTLNTALVDIGSPDGRFLITDNSELIYDYVNNDLTKPYLRVQLGRLWNITNGALAERKDSSGNYVYGFEVRDKDGQTIMIDGQGVHNEGITSGAVDNSKIAPNANIDAAKLDMESVVTAINNGAKTVNSSKIQVNDTTLDLELSSMTTSIGQKASKDDIYQGEIYIKGGGNGQYDGREVLINNIPITLSSTQGFNLIVLDRTTLKVISNQDYTPDAIDSMANALNNLKSGVIVLITSCNYISSDDLLITALQRCGASLGKDDLSGRAAYAFIGIPGIGKGNGLEAFNLPVTLDDNTKGNAQAAFLSTKVINGVPQGVNSTNVLSVQVADNTQQIVQQAATIKSMNDQINLRVTSQEVDTKINNIQVGVTNLWKNGSFELRDPYIIYNPNNWWNVSRKNDNYANLLPTDGSYSLFAYLTFPSTTNSWFGISDINGWRPIKPNTQYTVSFDFAWDESGGSVTDRNCYVIIRDNNGIWAYTPEIPMIINDYRYAFKRCSYTLTTPDNAKDMCLGFGLDATAGTFTWVQVDRIKLEEGNRATDWSPAPQDQDQQAQAYANTAQTQAVSTSQTYTDSKVTILNNSINLRVTRDEFNGLSIGGTNLVLNSTDSPHTYPNNTFGVKQNDGFWRLPLESNLQEILQEKWSNVFSGEKYTESFLLRTDGTLNSLNITFFTNNAVHHPVQATIINLGNNIFKASSTYTSQADDTSIRAMDINSISITNGTYIDIKYPKLEQGNKSTDWSPNSKDIVNQSNNYTDSQFNILNGEINTKVDANGVISTLQQKPTELIAAFTGASNSNKVIIKNGNFALQNNAGVDVLYADTAGNLTVTGSYKSDVDIGNSKTGVFWANYNNESIFEATRNWYWAKDGSGNSIAVASQGVYALFGIENSSHNMENASMLFIDRDHEERGLQVFADGGLTVKNGFWGESAVNVIGSMLFTLDESNLRSDGTNPNNDLVYVHVTGTSLLVTTATNVFSASQCVKINGSDGSIYNTGNLNTQYIYCTGINSTGNINSTAGFSTSGDIYAKSYINSQSFISADDYIISGKYVEAPQFRVGTGTNNYSIVPRSPSDNSGIQMFFENGGNLIWQLNDGSLRFSGGGAVPSDIKLKENISYATVKCLDVINVIKRYSFDYKDKLQGHIDNGVIAQDLQAINPQLVTTWGKDADGTEYYAPNWSVISPYIIGAIQELSNKNTELENRVVTLEKEIEDLKASIK